MLMLMLMLIAIPIVIVIECAKDRKDEDKDVAGDGVMLVMKEQVEVSGCGLLRMMVVGLLPLVPLNKLIVFGIDF